MHGYQQCLRLIKDALDGPRSARSNNSSRVSFEDSEEEDKNIHGATAKRVSVAGQKKMEVEEEKEEDEDVWLSDSESVKAEKKVSSIIFMILSLQN